MKDRIGVVTAAFGDDPREAPKLARRAGFAGVLFDAAGPSLRIDQLSASGRRDFSRHLASHGIALIGLQCHLDKPGLGKGSDLDRILSQMRRLMEAARDISSPLICLDLGPLPPAPASPATPAPVVTKELAGRIILPESPRVAPTPAPTQPATDPATEAQFLTALSEIGNLADRLHQTLALRSTQAILDSLHHWISRVACPWFGIDLDPVALLTESGDYRAVFSRIGPLLRHVRARDAARGPAQHMPTVLGQGDVDWPRLFSLLDESAYAGWITVDPMDLRDREAGATAGLKQLNAWLQ